MFFNNLDYFIIFTLVSIIFSIADFFYVFQIESVFKTLLIQSTEVIIRTIFVIFVFNLTSSILISMILSIPSFFIILLSISSIYYTNERSLMCQNGVTVNMGLAFLHFTNLVIVGTIVYIIA